MLTHNPYRHMLASFSLKDEKHYRWGSQCYGKKGQFESEKYEPVRRNVVP